MFQSPFSNVIWFHFISTTVYSVYSASMLSAMRLFSCDLSSPYIDKQQPIVRTALTLCKCNMAHLSFCKNINLFYLVLSFLKLVKDLIKLMLITHVFCFLKYPISLHITNFRFVYRTRFKVNRVPGNTGELVTPET